MLNMKIVCECGNESIFNTIDEDTGEPTSFTEDEGQYATMKPDTFRFLASTRPSRCCVREVR